jgi:NADH:ubiquinone oxidoreductase subunit 3 (subunit A)
MECFRMVSEFISLVLVYTTFDNDFLMRFQWQLIFRKCCVIELTSIQRAF